MVVYCNASTMERFEVTQASTLTAILWDEDEIFAVVALAGGGTRPMRTKSFSIRRHFKPQIPLFKGARPAAPPWSTPR